MVDKAMVEEVRGLLKEGYTLDKIKANLVKIGFSGADADEIIAAAQPGPAATAPAPEVDLGLATPLPSEEASEDDMLLAADNSEPIAGPAAAPPRPGRNDAGSGSASNPRAPPRPPRPSKGEPQPPASMSEEEKPKSGAGKAFIIFLLAFIVIAALAYLILFPKLGIEIALPF